MNFKEFFEMKKFNILAAILLTAFFAFSANAQGRERFTGTVLFYSSAYNPRTVTTNFNLDITGKTSDQETRNYLNILKEDGQNEVLNAIDNTENGRFSIGSNVGVPVNVVRETDEKGDRKIFIVFKRWIQSSELRYGYRSTDYPFGVIELNIDPETGKGEGKYFAAARIKLKNKVSKTPTVEVENFATFPAKLLGVKSNRQRG